MLNLSDAAVSFFESYLTHLKQRTLIRLADSSSKYSDVCDITPGVPQGSILGPFLFTIYMYDFLSNLKSKLTMYADDTQALLSFLSNDCQAAKALLQNNLDIISSWSVENPLILNAAKTILIIIDPSDKMEDVEMFDLTLTYTIHT